MIKKYAMMISVLLVMLMFISTSTASFVFSKGKTYEILPENLAFKKILDELSQIASDNNDGEYDDETDEEYDDGKHDDEPDEEYDDGEWDDDEVDDGMVDLDDGLEKDGPLPKIWDLVGEKTPDDGNEPVDDSKEALNTIDHPDGENDAINEETTDEDEWTVDSDGDAGAAVSNEITIPDYIDEGEWTVEQFVEIITERNVKVGEMLQRVVRTFAPGTTESDGTVENDIVDVVVEGGSVGTVENDIVGVVVEGGSVGTVENDVVDNIVLNDVVDNVVLTDSG